MRRCSPGTSSASGYSHYELYRRLVDFSSVASVGSSASRCRSCQHEKLGLRLNAKKSVLSPLQRTTFLGVIWDLMSMQARLSPAHLSILSAVERIRLGQSLTVRQFQRLLGLMAAASKVIPLDCCTWDPCSGDSGPKGFPEGQPLLHDQGHAAMPSWLGNVKETLVPVPGSHVGSFMSSQDANDRCLPHGLGSDLGGTLESRSVEGPSSLMAHQPPGDVGCISCSQEFPDRSQGPPCACPLRQHIGGLLHKSPGRFEVTSTLQTGVPNPPVVLKEVVVSASNLHPGAHNIGADILSRQGLRPGDWRLHPEVVELIWKESARHKWICLHLERRLTAHSGSPSRIQLLSDWMRWHRCGRGFILRISPDRSAPGSTGESSPGPSPTTSYCPAVAGQSMVPKSILPSRRASSGAPRQEGPSVQAGGSIFHPHPELWKLWAWSLRGPSS